MKRKESSERRGIIVPLIAVGVVALIGLVALAVDIGRLALAKSTCQAAADASAIAGARSLDGTQNLSAATAAASSAATSYQILGTNITASEVAVSHGSYHSDVAAQKFTPQIPA